MKDEVRIAGTERIEGEIAKLRARLRSQTGDREINADRASGVEISDNIE